MKGILMVLKSLKNTMDNKRKQILVLIAAALLITLSGVALAINGNWFEFTQTPDLTTPGLKLDSPFILSSLPEYFQISVTMTGSGNTGMVHQVSIIIEHNRVEDGFWEATAPYSLALKEGENVIDVIDEDSFTDLREYDSYVKPLTWIPLADPSGYQIVLDIHEVSWKLVVARAEFVVSDLSITPEEVEPGDEVTISVNVTNIGETEGSYTVELKVDGGTIETETVTLAREISQSISFTISLEVEGTHTVEIDGQSGSFTVKAPPKPAEFLFSGLEVTPMEVEEGLKVTVTVEVSNVGELEGSYTVELKVDGYVVDSEEVTLEGGESVTILFDLTRDEGTYQVEVEGMTGSFTVTAPGPPSQ